MLGAALLSGACASRLPPGPRATHVPASRPSGAKPPPVQTVQAQVFEQDKNRVKRALAADSRNTLAPGNVGYYLDVLNGRMRQVAGADVVIGRGFDRVVLDLSARVKFAAGGKRLLGNSCHRLGPIADVILEYRKTLVSIRVGAHADNADAAALALARARSVAACLTADGVSARRIVVTAATDAHVRVEMQIEPIVRL